MAVGPGNLTVTWCGWGADAIAGSSESRLWSIFERVRSSLGRGVWSLTQRVQRVWPPNFEKQASPIRARGGR